MHAHTCTNTHARTHTKQESLTASEQNSIILLSREERADKRDELDSQIQEEKGDYTSKRKLKEAGAAGHTGRQMGGQAEAQAPTHVCTRTPQQAPTPLGAPGRGSVRFAGRMSGCAEAWMGSGRNNPELETKPDKGRRQRRF